MYVCMCVCVFTYARVHTCMNNAEPKTTTSGQLLQPRCRHVSVCMYVFAKVCMYACMCMSVHE
jgi:hypothetical protein